MLRAEEVVVIARKEFAERLGVTPARLSQMVTSQEIAPAIVSASGRFWTTPYVREVVACRSNTRASKAVSGLRAPRVSGGIVAHAVVHIAAGSIFAVLLSCGDSSPIVLLQPLTEITKPLPAEHVPHPVFAPLLGSEPPVDDWVLTKALPLVGGELGLASIYDVAWVWHSGPYASEIVVADSADPELRASWDAEVERVPWQVVRAAAGRRIPSLGPCATSEPVVRLWEEHRSAVDGPVSVTVDAFSRQRRAAAAVILSGLIDDVDEGARPHLLLAISRLVDRIGWDRTGMVEPLVPRDADVFEWLAVAEYPDLSEVERLLPVDARVTGRPMVAPLLRDQAAWWLAARRSSVSGEFGSAPDEDVARALDEGMWACVEPLFATAELDAPRIPEPRVSIVRDGEAPSHGSVLHEYLNAARPAGEPATPGGRALEQRLRSSLRLRQSIVWRRDALGNDVAVVETSSGDVDSYAVVVPTLEAIAHGYAHTQTEPIEEIIVDRRLQSGPLLVRTASGLSAAPLPEESRQFAHGYSGTGPTELRRALEQLATWAWGDPQAQQILNLVQNTSADDAIRLVEQDLYE